MSDNSTLKRVRRVHLIPGARQAVEIANNMLALGWVVLETGMSPYGWPMFLMGWDNPLDNPPDGGALV